MSSNQSHKLPVLSKAPLIWIHVFMYHKNVECNISQTSHEFEQSFRMSINNEPYNWKLHINLLFSSNFAFIWLLCLRLIAIKSVWHASVSLMSKHLMRLRLNKSNISFTNFRYIWGKLHWHTNQIFDRKWMIYSRCTM